MTWRKVTRLELANVTMGANVELRVLDIEAQYGTGGLTSCGNLWHVAKRFLDGLVCFFRAMLTSRA